MQKVLSRVEAPKHDIVLKEIRHKAFSTGAPPLWEVAKEVIKKHQAHKQSVAPEPEQPQENGKIDKSREIIAQLKQEIRELKAQRDKLIKANGELKKKIAVYEAALNAGMQRSVSQTLAG